MHDYLKMQQGRLACHLSTVKCLFAHWFIYTYLSIYVCIFVYMYVFLSVFMLYLCVYFIMWTCLKFAIHEITKVWFFLNFFRHFCEKTIILILVLLFFFSLKGTSAYAGPHYHKLYGRVIHVWDNRRGQPNLSAMKQPRSGRSSSVIKFASPSGKYAFSFDFFTYIIISYLLNCQLELQIINISHL